MKTLIRHNAMRLFFLALPFLVLVYGIDEGTYLREYQMSIVRGGCGDYLLDYLVNLPGSCFLSLDVFHDGFPLNNEHRKAEQHRCVGKFVPCEDRAEQVNHQTHQQDFEIVRNLLDCLAEAVGVEFLL